MGGGGGGGGGFLGNLVKEITKGASKTVGTVTKGAGEVIEGAKEGIERVVVNPTKEILKDPLKPIKNPDEARYDALKPIAEAGNILAEDIQDLIGRTGIRKVGDELSKGNERISININEGKEKIRENFEGASEDLKNIGRNLTGEDQREAIRRSEERAIAEENKRNADLEEEKMRGKKSKEYGKLRARQFALMGYNRGRAGTMITNPNSKGTSSFLGLGSGTGKTLLGS